MQQNLELGKKLLTNIIEYDKSSEKVISIANKVNKHLSSNKYLRMNFDIDGNGGEVKAYVRFGSEWIGSITGKDECQTKVEVDSDGIYVAATRSKHTGNEWSYGNRELESQSKAESSWCSITVSPIT